MTDFDSFLILESYREINEDHWEQKKQKEMPTLNRYLIIQGDEVILSSDNWEMYMHPAFGRNDKVIDLQTGKYTTNGIDWELMEIE
jgi:hypothetical protein